MDQAVVQAYAEEMSDGVIFDPVSVFYDGDKFHLAHGYHRFSAARLADVPALLCTIYSGTLRDAVLFSLGANEKGALPLSIEDKKKAVRTLLEDEEWKQWSDHYIAGVVKLSQPTVSRIRNQLREVVISREADEFDDVIADAPKEERKYVNKHGQEATMKVAVKAPVVKEESVDESMLTDADWLSSLPLWPSLGGNRAFIRSALMWRTLHQRGALGQVKNHISRSRGDKQLGNSTLERLLSDIIRLRHPRDWQLCPVCKGAGCENCGSGGYVFSGGIQADNIKKPEGDR